MIRLLGVDPVNSIKFTAMELKKFITDKLSGVHPNVATKTTLAVVMHYLMKVSELHLDGERLGLEEAATQARAALEGAAPQGAPGEARGQMARGAKVRSLSAGSQAGKGSKEDDESEEEAEESGDEGGKSEQEGEKESSDDKEDDGDDELLENGDKGWVIEAIKGEREVNERGGGARRKSKKVVGYLVRWQDYGTDEESWEPATGIEADDAIAPFNARSRDARDADDSDDSDDNAPLA
jgi:hypothetical protein